MGEHGWTGHGSAVRQPHDLVGLKSSRAAKAIAWSALAAAAIANLAGYVFDLYEQFWWFDRVLHAATLFAITLWLALFTFAPCFREGFRFRVFLLVLSLGLAIGAIWEVAEWAYDQVAPGDVIKGKHDTLLDIVMDGIGTVCAATLCHRFWR